MEKYDLLILILSRDSLLLDSSREDFARLKQNYALNNATLVLVFLGERANRVISGEQIYDIEALPCFDDSEGKEDVVISIQGWIYEAQSNIISGNIAKMRTAVFLDIADDLAAKHCISPAGLTGGLEDTYFYRKSIDINMCSFELIGVSPIEKLQALAETGDEHAMYELGIAYAKGDGVELNIPKGQMLLYKSYLRGNINAIRVLVEEFDNPQEHFIKEAAKHGFVRDKINDSTTNRL